MEINVAGERASAPAVVWSVIRTTPMEGRAPVTNTFDPEVIPYDTKTTLDFILRF